MDRLLARSAWEGQMTAQPAERPPDNLWTSPPGRQAARGDFDERARSSSPQLWLVTHPRLSRLGVLASGLIAAGLVLRRRNEGDGEAR
jgi:hypothetical protein